MKLVDPTAKNPTQNNRSAPRLTSLKRLRIGLLCNGKANARALLLKTATLFSRHDGCEIENNMEDISEICKVEKFRYIPSKMNPADLATRTNGKLADIDINSEWQSPSFLKQDISSWPMTR